MAPVFPAEELTPVRRGAGHFYEQIRDQIAALIATHGLPAGTKLPTESELITRFETSRMTIRVGLQQLEAAGMVEPRHGVGVFVRDRPADPSPSPDAVAVQSWVRAVDEIITAAPAEIQSQYQAARSGLPEWARPNP